MNFLFKVTKLHYAQANTYFKPPIKKIYQVWILKDSGFRQATDFLLSVELPNILCRNVYYHLSFEPHYMPYSFSNKSVFKDNLSAIPIIINDKIFCQGS